ncbi:MAG: hypothetical protein ACYTG0_46250, partial [Planctomycetota bacterium]
GLNQATSRSPPPRATPSGRPVFWPEMSARSKNSASNRKRPSSVTIHHPPPGSAAIWWSRSALAEPEPRSAGYRRRQRSLLQAAAELRGGPRLCQHLVGREMT